MSRTPFYQTASEITGSTRIGDLRDANDNSVNPLILEAEDLIDAFVGDQPHHLDDDNTDRVFPRREDEDDDGNAEIPEKVKRATLAIVEMLFLRGEPTLDDIEGGKESEHIGESAYSYKKKGSNEAIRAMLPPKAQMLLRDFKVGSCSINSF